MRIETRSAAIAAFLGGFACIPVGAEPPKAESGGAKAGVAATIGGEPITTAELDARALKINMKLAQSLYDARKQALDQVVMERLLGPEAKEKGVPVDKLLEQKIAEAAKPVSDGDVEGYYKANAARMGGKTLEQMSAQIKAFLAGQQQNLAKESILASLKQKADIKIMLDPPRVEVALGPNDPMKGSKDAKVTIVEFSEFQ